MKPTFSPSTFLLTTSKEYSLYICQQRSIPKIADGLKPVQRMALWIIKDKAQKFKTVSLSGLLSYEKLYVHGEASANDAIGELAAPYKNNVPLIEGLGHFGSRIAPDAIGAPRYTEVKRARAAEELLYVDIDLVPLEDNYDGSTKQPKHFLPLIPLALLNGISGIAVGWSTDILPRKLRDIIDAAKAVLTDKPIKPLVPYYAKYDLEVNNIGENKWELLGKARVEGNTVYITELPPGLDIETFRKRLNQMEDADQIAKYEDRSSDRIDIMVKLKRRGAMGDLVDMMEERITTPKQAIDFFKIRERVTERIVVVDWNGEAIRTYKNAEDVVTDFVHWRLAWYNKRFQYMIDQDTYELLYWKVLKILFEKGFTKRLGTFANKTEMIEDVKNTIDIVLDDKQLDRVVSLPTYRWTKEFLDTVNENISSLEKSIITNKEILASPEKLKEAYVNDLNKLRNLTKDLEDGLTREKEDV